jgi:hypothetical protein
MRNINILNNSGINKDIYGYWPLNETGGKIITDRIGGHNATTTSDITQKGIPAMLGGAMDFSNSNYITCSNIDIPPFPYTMSFWVYLDGFGTFPPSGAVFHEFFRLDNGIILYFVQVNSANWQLRTSITDTSGTTAQNILNGVLAPGGNKRKYGHVVIQSTTSTSTTSFLNGTYSRTLTRGVPNNFTSFTIGTGSSEVTFKMIDLKIWKRLLNNNEIFQLSQRPYYGTEVGITRYQEIISTRGGSWFFFD